MSVCVKIWRTADKTRRLCLDSDLCLLFDQRLEIAKPLGPAFLNGLSATSKSKRIGRHVSGDHRARTDISAVADGHRRNQRRIGADEGALADIGAVLGPAVVVAGDGAGADVGAR